MMSFDEGNSVGELKDGVLTIEPAGDMPSKYSRGGTDNTDLIYTE